MVVVNYLKFKGAFGSGRVKLPMINGRIKW
jgi:hypothetical protein